MRKTAILLVALLSGCGATVHGPASVGDGRYLVGVSNLSGTWTHPELKMKAIEQAEAHCKSQGKALSVVDSKTSGAVGWTSTEAEVTFECVEKK